MFAQDVQTLREFGGEIDSLPPARSPFGLPVYVARSRELHCCLGKISSSQTRLELHGVADFAFRYLEPMAHSFNRSVGFNAAGEHSRRDS